MTRKPQAPARRQGAQHPNKASTPSAIAVMVAFNSGGSVNVNTNEEPQIRPNLGVMGIQTEDGGLVIPIASIKYAKTVVNNQHRPSAPAEGTDGDGNSVRSTDQATIQALRLCYRSLVSSEGLGSICDDYDPAGPGAGVEADGKPQCATCGHPAVVHGAFNS